MRKRERKSEQLVKEIRALPSGDGLEDNNKTHLFCLQAPFPGLLASSD